MPISYDGWKKGAILDSHDSTNRNIGILAWVITVSIAFTLCKRTNIKLFRAPVQPILLYCSENLRICPLNSRSQIIVDFFFIL